MSAPTAPHGSARLQPARALPSPRTVGAMALRYALLLVVTVLMVGPIIGPLLTSFKSSDEDVFGQQATLLPQRWSFHAYETLFAEVPIPLYIANSLLLAGLLVLSQIVFATTAGYMLSRRGWRGRSAVWILVVSGMIFPFESIMLALYTTVQNLGLLDTIAGVWLPGIVGVFNVMIMRASFMAVPDGIEEAALLDGAGEFRRFFSIFVPSAKGALVIVVLTSFIGAWDDFLWPLIVLHSDQNFTLTLGLARLQSSFGFDYRVLLAGAMVALVPVILIFFAAQRYFFRGVEEGGMKF
jgi:ABC-type glycerol-3-phosphate transport system permease component